MNKAKNFDANGLICSACGSTMRYDRLYELAPNGMRFEAVFNCPNGHREFRYITFAQARQLRKEQGE